MGAIVVQIDTFDAPCSVLVPVPRAPPPPWSLCQRQQSLYLLLEPKEPQVEDFGLWYAGARASISEDGSASAHHMVVAPSTNSTANDDDKEVGLLMKMVEKLEEANATLKEKLVEARLEMTALRRTSVERGEAVLDQVAREFIDEKRQRLSVSWGAPPGGTCRGVGHDGWKEESVCQDDGERARSRWPDQGVSGSADNQELTPLAESAQCSDGDNDPPSREDQEQHVGQDGVGVAAPVSSKGRVGSRRTSDDSDGDETRRYIVEAAMTAISDRRLSSSALKDAEEHTKLLEALRKQISELRQQLQTTRSVSNASAAGAGKGGRRGTTSSSAFDPRDDDDRQARNLSKYVSEDDGRSDRHDCDDGGIDRKASDDHGNNNSDNTLECKHCLSRRQRVAYDESILSEGCVGGGRGKRGGGDVHSGGDGNEDRVDDDWVQASISRARIDELSAELKEGKLAFDALQQRLRQEQAACLQMQRALLRLQGAKENRTVMVAAVALASARRSGSSTAAHTARHDPGGDDGPESERRSNCLNHHGFRWLQRLWRSVWCVSGEERELESGFGGRSFDETNIGGGGGTAAFCGETNNDSGGMERGDCRGGQGVLRRRLLATEREPLLTATKTKGR